MRTRFTLLVILLVAATCITAAAAPVTITYMTWGDAATAEVEQKVIAAFEKKYPNIKVEMLIGGYAEYHDKLLTAILGGVAPDIALIDIAQYHDYAHRDLLVDVTDWIKKDKFESSQIQPAFWDEMTVNGRMYSVANSRSGRIVMYYDKSKFVEYGVPTPHQVGNWNTETFMQIAKQMTKDTNGDGETDYWGLQRYEQNWHWAVWGNGGDFMNKERTALTFSDPRTVEALQWLADARYVHGITGRNAWFNQKKAAIYMNWDTGDITNLRRTADFEWDIIAPPAGRVSQTTLVKGNAVAIPVGAKHPKEAWEFMKFLGGEEAQYIYGINGRFFPSHRRAGLRVLNETRNLQPEHFITSLNINGRPLPLCPAFLALRTMYEKELGPWLSGTEPAASAAARIDEMGKAIFQQYK